MSKPEDFGAETDGGASSDYCSCCYQDGTFTEPDVTREEMALRVIGIVTQHKILSAEEASEQIPALFRTLKRWRNA